MGQKFYSHHSYSRKKSRLGPALMIGGGGLAIIGGIWYGFRKSTATTDAVERALRGEPEPVEEGAPPALPGAAPKTGSVKVRATGYWPFTARADEKQMEGGVKDRKGKPLYTLEEHLAGRAPYVAVSGDDAIWPYGQRISIDAWPTATFRVVDTGSHFRGAGKLFRVMGYEPLDICVNSSATVVPKLVTATIYPGDNFAKGTAVATGKFKDQVVGDVLGAAEVLANVYEGRTNDDQTALARALESELGGHTRDEMLVAGWSMRNRADESGLTVRQLLAPNDVYGAPQKSGGYASTRKAATPMTMELASLVLDAAPSADPTEGAVEFWLPQQQTRLREFGDVHRAASKNGDEVRAKRYARYADYGSENDIRALHANDGLRVLGTVGAVELLGRL